MEINEIRVRIVKSGPDKLQAFCSVTIDGMFVVRDLKIIEGPKGFFVAMPSRKLTDRCPRCDGKNHLRARFCNDCGARLADDRAEKDTLGRAKLHVDIAHPINPACREMFQKEVLAAFHQELEHLKRLGRAPAAIPENDYTDVFEDEGLQAEEEKAAAEKTESEFGKGLF